MANQNRKKMNRSYTKDNRNSKRTTAANQTKEFDKETPRRGKFSQEQISTDTYNDVSWYAKNQQMLIDAASYSYNRPLGSAIRFGDYFAGSSAGGGTTLTIGDTCHYIPGVIAMDICITPGLSVDRQSPINLASQNIYSYVRYMNSGAKNYDAPDMMLYLLAMDSLYALFNHLKRVYGLVSAYSQQNWYIPDIYTSALNVDMNDIRQNLADFRLFLNTFAAQITSFCVPAVMPLFVRHSWLFSNVYKDSDTEKAQLYVFNPAYFFIYNETSEGGGSLQPYRWQNDVPKKFEDIKSYVNTIMQALKYSEDIGIMSGDILKAYGQDKLFKITPIDPDYTVTPVYKEEVLNQIHNATVVGMNNNDYTVATNSSMSVTQNVDQGILVWNPNWAATAVNRKGAFINMPWNTVTPANTMVGTRLTAATYVKNNRQYFAGVGSDFVGSMRVLQYANASTPGIVSRKTTYLTTQAVVARPDTTTWADVKSTVAQLINNVSLLSNFDWHPLYYVWIGTTTGSESTLAFTLELEGVVGDINNYTFIDNTDLTNLHLTAVMSEFNIPQLGSF